MGWLLFESFVALIVVVAIVWWTMRPVHRRDRAHAARRAHDEVTADDRARAPDTADAAGRRDEHRP